MPQALGIKQLKINIKWTGKGLNEKCTNLDNNKIKVGRHLPVLGIPIVSKFSSQITPADLIICFANLLKASASNSAFLFKTIGSFFTIDCCNLIDFGIDPAKLTLTSKNLSVII